MPSGFEETKELDFSFSVEGLHRFRGNAYLQRGSVAGAFRLIPDRVPTIEELKLPEVVRELALTPQGLVLVTGPTGHGKSTTQAAMIDIINRSRRLNIITLEDPIEFVHKSAKSLVVQREVGTHVGSFKEGLRAALREDPDVILVGELRDPETISMAMTAAETGHLVLGTLHTSSATKTLDRIIDAMPTEQKPRRPVFCPNNCVWSLVKNWLERRTIKVARPSLSCSLPREARSGCLKRRAVRS